MYWDEELARLAAHKAALQRSIGRGRASCTEAAAIIVRPVERIDRIAAIWRGIPPSVKFGAVPLGLLLTRFALPRRGILGALVRWGPIAYSVIFAISSGAGKGRSQSAREKSRA